MLHEILVVCYYSWCLLLYHLIYLTVSPFKCVEQLCLENVSFMAKIFSCAQTLILSMVVQPAHFWGLLRALLGRLFAIVVDPATSKMTPVAGAGRTKWSIENSDWSQNTSSTDCSGQGCVRVTEHVIARNYDVSSRFRSKFKCCWQNPHHRHGHRGKWTHQHHEGKAAHSWWYVCATGHTYHLSSSVNIDLCFFICRYLLKSNVKASPQSWLILAFVAW